MTDLRRVLVDDEGEPVLEVVYGNFDIMVSTPIPPGLNRVPMPPEQAIKKTKFFDKETELWADRPEPPGLYHRWVGKKWVHDPSLEPPSQGTYENYAGPG